MGDRNVQQVVPRPVVSRNRHSLLKTTGPVQPHTSPSLPQTSSQRALRMRFDGAGKLLVPMLAVLAILSLVGAGAAIWLQIQEREKRHAAERELRFTMAERDELKGQLEQVQQAKSRIEEELGHVRKDLLTTQDKLSQAVASQEALSRAVEDRQKEIARVTKELDQSRTEHQELSKQVTELTQEREELGRQLAELEQAKSDLESKVTQLSDQPTVELDKIVVSNPQPLASGAVAAVPVSAVVSSPAAGQVIVINREYDFIVINLGKKQGLSIGQEFQVVRGSEVLGKVKVEKVYDELSAAAILPESQKENIREGDTVRAL